MQKGGEVKMTCWINANGNPPKPSTLEELGFVRVVRCKDCKFYRPNNPSVGCLKVVRSENADGDWFCADGERKEGR